MAVNTGVNSAMRHQQVEVGVLDIDSGTGTCVTNAVTINRGVGVITTESLTTAGAASQAIALTNSEIAVGDMIHIQWVGGTNTTVNFNISAVAVAGGATITLNNTTAATAFNGTFILAFLVIKARAAGNFVQPV